MAFDVQKILEKIAAGMDPAAVAAQRQRMQQMSAGGVMGGINKLPATKSVTPMVAPAPGTAPPIKTSSEKIAEYVLWKIANVGTTPAQSAMRAAFAQQRGATPAAAPAAPPLKGNVNSPMRNLAIKGAVNPGY